MAETVYTRYWYHTDDQLATACKKMAARTISSRRRRLDYLDVDSMGAKPEPPSAALPGLIILPHDRSR